MFLSVIFSVFSALRITTRDRFDIKDIAAWTDKEIDGGGLLMELFENQEISEWENLLEQINIPNCRIPWKKPVFTILGGLLFVSVCSFIQLPDKNINIAPQSLDISKPVGELKTKLGVLEEIGAIDEERKLTIENAIKTLEANRAALEPGKIYENIDALESMMQHFGNNSFDQYAKTVNLTQEMDAVSERLAKAKDEEVERKLRDMAKRLSDLLNKMSILPNDEVNKILNDCFAENGNLNQEFLEELAKQLKQCRGNIRNDLMKLKKCGLCQLTDKDLEALLADGEPCNISLISSPGNGGVDRGRGDAPITFGQETPYLTGLKQEKIENQNLAPDVQEVVGVSFAAPEQAPIDDGAQAGKLNTDAGSGGTAKRQRIAPHDRELIKKYFDKKKNFNE